MPFCRFSAERPIRVKHFRGNEPSFDSLPAALASIAYPSESGGGSIIYIFTTGQRPIIIEAAISFFIISAFISCIRQTAPDQL